jgi:LysR family transcriptional regulator, transcriptional activator of nhaA
MSAPDRDGIEAVLMLNYNHLHYFHVVATEGSIARAATTLRVSQPTVSEQVRTLERYLGVRLFDREGGRLNLTEAGRLAYEHTTTMFRAGERLVQALGKGKSIPRSLRVGISSAVSRTTTTDFLMPLFAIDSCIPSIRSGDSSDLVRALRGGEVDLVLLEGEPADTKMGLITALIDSTKLVAVAPAGTKPKADWQDLGLLHYRAPSAFRWEVEAYLEKHALHPQIVGEADDPTFLLESAMRGGYLAIVPRSIVRDAVRAKRAEVIAEIDASHAGVHAVYEDGESAQLARRAVEVLVNHARSLNE